MKVSIRPEIKKDLKTILQLFFSIWQGWLLIVLELFHHTRQWWLRKKKVEMFISIMLFMQLIFSLMGWIGYEIDFGDGKESYAISANTNLYFITISFFNLILIEFLIGTLSVLIAFILQLAGIILFIVGLIYPNPVFVSFIKKTDYHFLLSFYLFAFFLVMNTLISVYKLRNEKRQ